VRPAAREIASAAELSPLMSAIGRQLLSKLTSERDSVVSTEPNVENQRIDLLLDQEAGHAHAVRSLEYPMSLQLEQGREERAKAVVVLGGQNRRSFLQSRHRTPTKREEMRDEDDVSSARWCGRRLRAVRGSARRCWIGVGNNIDGVPKRLPLHDDLGRTHSRE
jgi:hypothetical protein